MSGYSSNPFRDLVQDTNLLGPHNPFFLICKWFILIFVHLYGVLILCSDSIQSPDFYKKKKNEKEKTNINIKFIIRFSIL